VSSDVVRMRMHGSRSKIPSKKSRPYIYVKFLALLGAPYIYDISRLRVNELRFGDKVYDENVEPLTIS
jgi:hypothetical protein